MQTTRIIDNRNNAEVTIKCGSGFLLYDTDAC